MPDNHPLRKGRDGNVSATINPFISETEDFFLPSKEATVSNGTIRNNLNKDEWGIVSCSIGRSICAVQPVVFVVYACLCRIQSDCKVKGGVDSSCKTKVLLVIPVLLAGWQISRTSSYWQVDETTVQIQSLWLFIKCIPVVIWQISQTSNFHDLFSNN